MSELNPTHRNVICISDMPPDIHQWVKDEAKRRAKQKGGRYAVALVYLEAVELLKTKLENDSNGAEEVEHG